jgi:hypothetical protein
MTANLQDLKEHLQRSLPSLRGDWVSGKRKYESFFASAMGATFQEGRYWDCIWNGIYLELKMGNIWLDLVRYSEYILKRTQESHVVVITLFMRYREQRITDIYAVTTENLIRALNLSARTAEDLLRIKHEVPRSLNAQASLTENDVRKIAEFHVRSTTHIA